MTPEALADATRSVRIQHFRLTENGGAMLPAGTFKKRLCGGAIPALRAAPKGGMTIVTIEFNDGMTSEGRAYCSKKDNFSRKRGREIALGRALKAAIEHIELVEHRAWSDVTGTQHPVPVGV